MSKHLFLFTISQVQSFIQQARKTQDLYAGSQLLSAIMDRIIQKLQDEHQAEILFPAAKIASKPNRVLAILKADNPQSIGKQLEDAVTAQFESFAKEARDRAFECNKPEKFEVSVERQLRSFWDISWVALPYDKDYRASYEQIERMLGGVKNIRQFRQLPEKGRKCALCGERNVLFYRSDDIQGDKTPQEQEREKQRKHLEGATNVRTAKFQAGEGLCTVCTLKRFFTKTSSANFSFPSTARIALMETLARLSADEEGKHLLNAYRKQYPDDARFDDARFDEQLYFEENLTTTYFKKNDLGYIVENEECLRKIRAKHKDIRAFANTRKVHFSPYYAVLVFDGDSMGTWLSGIHLKEPDKNLQEFHHRLSELLGDFAKGASHVLRDPLNKEISVEQVDFFGKAVYAGGDDFLGFVNLKHLFQTLQYLHTQFDEDVNKVLHNEFEFNNAAGAFTFSAGVAIAHYKAPLSTALQKARDMENKAKEVKSKELGNKDAVGFALLKHSGNIGETVFKWRFQENTLLLAQTLTKALQEWISNKFLYVLREELLRLFDNDTGIEPDIVEAELKRLMNRRKQKQEIPDAQVRELATRLIAFWDQLNSIGLEETSNFNHLTNFLNFLELCNFVARET